MCRCSRDGLHKLISNSLIYSTSFLTSLFWRYEHHCSPARRVQLSHGFGGSMFSLTFLSAWGSFSGKVSQRTRSFGTRQPHTGHRGVWWHQCEHRRPLGSIDTSCSLWLWSHCTTANLRHQEPTSGGGHDLPSWPSAGFSFHFERIFHPGFCPQDPEQMFPLRASREAIAWCFHSHLSQELWLQVSADSIRPELLGLHFNPSHLYPCQKKAATSKLCSL